MYKRLIRALDALECYKWAEFDVHQCADIMVRLWKCHKISTDEMHSIADRITAICDRRNKYV